MFCCACEALVHSPVGMFPNCCSQCVRGEMEDIVVLSLLVVVLPHVSSSSRARCSHHPSVQHPFLLVSTHCLVSDGSSPFLLPYTNTQTPALISVRNCLSLPPSPPSLSSRPSPPIPTPAPFPPPPPNASARASSPPRINSPTVTWVLPSRRSSRCFTPVGLRPWMK